jgi:hypothetical protein
LRGFYDREAEKALAKEQRLIGSQTVPLEIPPTELLTTKLRRLLSGKVLNAIRTLNGKGFTEIFTHRPLTRTEQLALSDCRWKRMDTFPPKSAATMQDIAAFLWNPHASTEPGCIVDFDGRTKRVKGFFGESLDIQETTADTAALHTEQGSAIMAGQDDRIITKDGVRYYPVSLAAQVVQAPRQTLLNWIKNNMLFDGEPLQTYDSPTAGKLFVNEESLKRVSNRFVRWPSNEPAGNVTIGHTPDQSGFLGMSAAAKIVGVTPRTMWVWVSQGAAPIEKPLDVIRCKTSNYFYVREKDISLIKSLIPPSGLHRGRRTQPTPQP